MKIILFFILTILTSSPAMAESHSPPQYAQGVLVQASQSQQTKMQYERTIGVCHLVNNPTNAPKVPWAGSDGLSPVVAVGGYFSIIENNLDFKYEGGRASILEYPKHGVLQATDDESYYYFPDTGYLGKDHVTFLVEIDGRKFKVIHYVQMMEIVPEYYGRNKLLCPNGKVWKISTALDANGNSTRTKYRFSSTSEYA
jgi:hypothetical protein